MMGIQGSLTYIKILHTPRGLAWFVPRSAPGVKFYPTYEDMSI